MHRSVANRIRAFYAGSWSEWTRRVLEPCTPRADATRERNPATQLDRGADVEWHGSSQMVEGRKVMQKNSVGLT